MKTFADYGIETGGCKTYAPASPCKRCGTSERFKSNSGCVVCSREHARAYRTKNLDALREKNRAWAKENPEKNREQSSRWASENKDKANAIRSRCRGAKWDEHYRPSSNAQAAKARADRRMPSWVDKEALISFYKNCPKGMTVDHIVPLKGKAVTGLHVPWNLQYLTRSENARKGARFDENMG